MLNMSGIKKTSAVTPNQILFNVDNQMSVGIKVAQAAGVTVGDRKIVKAGTPLNGDLAARGTSFKARADSTAPAVGVLLHDVDVTDGDGNGSLLIWGFVNLNRLESDAAALITATAKTELAGRVWFLKD